MNEGRSDFTLPSKARISLTSLLIVHPIAAFMTLVLFVLSVLAHLHRPAHSPKYLFALLILCLPTVMVSLLAFLVDILIFLPHVQWGGWIVLAATILIVTSGVVMCGIRRQVVSRLARSKRIQASAEMGDQNTYLARPDIAPVDSRDQFPEFATFEVNKATPIAQEGERIPLNPRVQQQDDQGFHRSNTLRTESSDRSNYGPQHRGNGPLGSGHNPMGGNASMAASQYSNHTLPSSISGSSGPYGTAQPIRGGAGYGQYPSERAHGDPLPMPGPYDRAPQGGRYGPPPPGAYRGGPPPGGFEPRRSPYPGYGPGPGRGPTPNNYGPGTYGPPPRGAGPPAMGMVTGLRAPPPRRQVPPPGPGYDDREYPAGIENNHSDERREFEQTLAPVNPDAIGRAFSVDGRGDGAQNSNLASESGSGSGKLTVVNETRPTYEEDSYIPLRPQWQQENGSTENKGMPSPAELPTSTPRQGPPSRSGSSKSKRASDSYYEDVAPQFDTSHERSPTPPLPTTSPHPTALTPGNPSAYAPPPGATWGSPPPIPDDIDNGQQSPTMSTASGFTSISQRGINPRWQEEQSRLGPGQSRGGAGRKSVGLAGNPDFELPIANKGRGGRPGFR